MFLERRMKLLERRMKLLEKRMNLLFAHQIVLLLQPTMGMILEMLLRGQGLEEGKRKATSGEKDKEPSVASTTAGLLEHLKEEGARKASNDEGVATALNKIAESSALAGKSMQAVADAILALVAQQAQLNK